MMSRRRVFITFALWIAALATGAAMAQVSDQVSQKGRAFHPNLITLQVGDTLHINNNDEFTHQVYVEDPAFTFESDDQDPGQTVDIKFTRAGAFDVMCHIHPKMKLHVIVQP